MLYSLFTNPWMLGALVAASIPIIIEWLFKRRKRQVELPTLIYLLDNKEHEQIKRQDRILLILRTLAIALLVMGLARPIIQHGMFGGAQQRHVVILLDSTASMQQQVGVTSSFGIAQKKAAAMVRSLPQDTTVTVGTLNDMAKSVLEAETDLHTIAGRIESLRPGSGSGGMGEGLGWAKSYLDSAKLDKAELYIFSDFQKQTWQPQGGDAGQVNNAFKELGGRCETFLIDVGGSPTFNYLVTSLRPGEWLLSTGKPVKFTAKVESTGKVPEDQVARVTFLVDGDKKDVRELTPGSSGGAIEFEHRFASYGEYMVEVLLEGDEHPIDNRRLYLCSVPESVQVLILDESAGSPMADTYFLMRAIEPLQRPGMDRVSRFAAKAIGPSQVVFENLDAYKAVIVAATSPMTESLAAKLEHYAAGGGAVWFFLGPKVSLYEYNKLLWKGGKGLLPVELGEPEAPQGKAPHLVLASASHPAMVELQKSAAETSAEFNRYMKLKLPSEGGSTEVMATLSDGAPLLVRKAFGRGQAILCSATAGAEWSLMPALPEYTIMTQEILKHLIGNPDAGVNLDVGARFEQDVFISAQHLLLRRPDGSRDRLTPRKKGESENAWTVSYQRANVHGTYEFVDVPKEVLTRQRFVVNPRTEEGDLTRLSESDFAGLFGSGGWSWLGPETSIEDFVAKLHSVTELSPWVLFVLTSILAVESFLAVKYGRRRAEVDQETAA